MQTGEPRQLYEFPADVSVARFLGRNNVINAIRLSSSKSSLGAFKTLEGGHTIHLPVSHDELAPLNKPCFLAIRPEHVVLVRDGSENQESEMAGNVLAAKIREIVFAGATSTVRLDANGLLLEALVLEPDGLKVGADCSVALPTNRLSLLKGD